MEHGRPIQPGSTVGVEVDSANPKNVRIGIGSPSRSGPQQATFFGTNMPTPGGPGNPMNVGINLSQGPGSGPVHSAAELLASGQRVSGVLKSFAPTGNTPRSLGRTPSTPELLDAPYYLLDIELHFPNLAPFEARNTQPVPPAWVPYLAIGLQLPCAVDPANPQQLCVVDWHAITR